MKAVSRYIQGLVLMFAILLLFGGRAQAGELMLNSVLMTELNQVLKAGDALHKSLVAQNEDQIELGIRDLIWHIDQARATSSYIKPHERGHLLLILDSARDQFELTRSTYGDERRERLEEGFNQLANLVRIYRVDRTYSIFFCPDDKKSWVQKGLKGQNPFRPRVLRDCGIRIVGRS